MRRPVYFYEIESDYRRQKRYARYRRMGAIAGYLIACLGIVAYAIVWSPY